MATCHCAREPVGSGEQRALGGHCRRRTAPCATAKSSSTMEAHLRAHRSAFIKFSEQLYCAGAVEHKCALPDGSRAPPGLCYWRSAVPNGTISAPGRPTDEWDPQAMGAAGYRRLTHGAARQCAHGKRILLLGDSTTRDTYYELAAVIGRPIWQSATPRFDKHFEQYWPRKQWSPKAPAVTSGAYDASGAPCSLRLPCGCPAARGRSAFAAIRDGHMPSDHCVNEGVCVRRHVQWQRVSEAAVCLREGPVVWAPRQRH